MFSSIALRTEEAESRVVDEVQVYKIEITVERDNAEPLTETVLLSYCGEPTSVVELESVRVQVVPAETRSE